MADASTNPYLALLQQQEQGPPSWAQILQHVGNLGFGLAGGFGQAAATGQPTMAAIGPGLMAGNQLNAQAAQQAEKDRVNRIELAMKAQHWGAEDEKTREEAAARKREADITDKLMQGLPGMLGGAVPGFQATQPTRLMGPDLKAGGAPLVDYLTTKHGLSPLAAATVAGNLYQESGFNPAATGDSGSAFGMGQWRLDRQTALRNFAATQNKPPTDPQVQLDYLVSEMKGGDMGAQRAYAGLQQAKTPEQANAAIMHFFRPAGYTPSNPAGGHGFQNRVQYTQALLPNGQPAPQGGPQVAQGATAPTQPQPRPGPTLSALPAFEGSGMGAIQPGALPEGVLPSVNLPAPAPSPPQVAQGGGSQFPVTESGASYDPNAQPPPFMQPGGPGPNVVQAQYQPQPGQAGMVVQPPRVDSLRVAPLLQSKTLAPFGRALIDIGNTESQRYTEDLKRQQAEEHFRQTHGLSVNADVRAAAAAKLAEEKAALDRAQAAVDPNTGLPQQGPIAAKAAAATAEAAARAQVEAQYGPGAQFAKAEIDRFAKDVQPGAEAAANGLPNLYEMKRLTGNMATGPLVDARILGARTLDWLGIRDMPEGMVNTTEYLNRASKGVISVLQTGALGKTQISEGDRKFVEAMAAKDAGYSQKELQRLVDIAIDSSHKTLGQYDKSAEKVGKLLGDKVPKDYFAIDRPSYEQWQKANPQPGQQGQPGTAATPMQPKTGDPLEGRTATGPNGQKVIRRNGQWEPVP